MPDAWGPLPPGVVDMSHLSFHLHETAITCVDISHDCKLAITGDKGNCVFIWNIADGGVYLECTRLTGPVKHVEFSKNSEYAASGDYNGLIQVWDLNHKKLVWCFKIGGLEWMGWRSVSNGLIAGSAAGGIYSWKIESFTNSCQMFDTVEVTTMGKILPGEQLITVSNADTINLWNLERFAKKWHITSPVTIMEVARSGSIFIVAPSLNLYRVRNGQLLKTFTPEINGTINSLAIDAAVGAFTIGILGERLRLWQMSDNTLLRTLNLEHTCTSTVNWGHDGRFFVSHGNSIHVFNGMSGDYIKSLTGHLSYIWTITQIKNTNTILTTSADASAKIFDLG